MKTILIVLLLFLGSDCQHINRYSKGLDQHYDLANPERILTLPAELKEISGFSLIGKEMALCIQDEKGTLFFLDLASSQISRRTSFAADGDYEAVTVAGNNAFVLRSDGLIFEVKNYASDKIETLEYDSNVPAMNNEGLCLDQKKGQLLIGCKSKPGKGKEFKELREIYSFGIADKKRSEKPVYVFNQRSLTQLALNNGIAVESQKGPKQEPMLRINTSEIAIHPLRGNLFLLSAADHMLFVFSPQGEPLVLQKLDPGIFNKPEGLDFASNGDLYISNEGQQGSATLLKFKYKP